MSRDWTPEELAAASTAMKAEGHMSYEEFCEELARVGIVVKMPLSPQKMSCNSPKAADASKRHPQP